MVVVAMVMFSVGGRAVEEAGAAQHEVSSSSMSKGEFVLVVNV